MIHKNFIYLCFENHTQLMSYLNTLPREAQILESGQLQMGHPTLLVSSHTHLTLKDIPGTVDGVQIEDPKLDLLKGYFKQLNTHVKKNLLVLESSKLSALFLTVDQLIKTTSYELIEISRATGGDTHSVAYLANGQKEEALIPSSHDLSIKLYEAPSAQLLSLFNI